MHKVNDDRSKCSKKLGDVLSIILSKCPRDAKYYGLVILRILIRPH